MNDNENNKIKDQVLEKIRAGEIDMRPRFYFVIKVVALIVLVFFTLMTSSLLVSFIIFSFIAGGAFPWTLLVFEIILLFLLETLLKHFRLGYRSSSTTLILIILGMSVALSLIIVSTSFHKTLQSEAEKNNLPVFGEYYRSLRHK